MSALVWDDVGERIYQTGTDRGVLYLPSGLGICWNGLTSVVEKTDKSQSSVYFDGQKINEFVSPGDFSATLKAITYPNEFMEFDGTRALLNGFSISDQPPQSFDLSYRTLIGNDVEGIDLGYKVHVLYNMFAVPKDRTFDTITDSPSYSEFEWDIWGIPQEVSGFRPTCHVIIDSRHLDPDLLEDVEELLYGTAIADPALPTMTDLIEFLQTHLSIQFIDHGDGTWTAIISDDDDLDYDPVEEEFSIFNVDATFPDADTWVASDTA